MPAAPSSGRKLSVFISYSREDLEFVNRLEPALKDRGFEPTIDRRDISAFEDWWKRIKTLIERADTIVYVVSPDSVRSKVALEEIAYAASLNKRFAPIVWRRVRPPDTVPEALAKLHFIFFDEPTQFETKADELAEGLVTNLGWIRQHTEFGEAERRWSNANRANGLLLRSPALEAAEHWIASRPANAPAPTQETQAFIRLSRQAATRRRNTLTASLAAGFFLALGLAGLAFWQRTLALEQRDATLMTQSQLFATAAYRALNDDDAVTGILLALEGLPSGEPGDERKLVKATENMVLSGLLNLRERDVIDVRGGAVVSRDGTRAAYGTGDDKVRVVDITTKSLVVEFAYEGIPESLSFSPDGRRLVTLNNYSKIQVWDLAASRALITLTNDNRFGSVTFSPDGNKLIFTNGPGRSRHAETKGGEINHGAMIFDMTTLRRTALISHPAKVFRAVMSEDARIIATAAEDKRVRVFDAAAGRVLHQLPEHPEDILDIALSRDGTHVVSGSRDGAARLWRTDTGALVHKFVSQAGSWFWAVGISVDGKQVLTNTGDGVTAWSIETGRQTWHVKTHVKELALPFTDTAEGFSFDQSEGTLVTAHVDNSLRIWNIGPLALAPQIIDTGCRTAPKLQASRDASIIVTSCEESHAIQVWDGQTSRPVVALAGVIGQPDAIVLAPDGATLAVWSKTNGLQLFSPRTGRALIAVAYKSEDASTAFESRGGRFALGLDDGSIRIWKRTSESWAAEPRLINAGEEGIACLAFSASGDRLLSVSLDGTPQIWNTETGARIALLRVPGEPAAKDQDRWSIRCAYAPDGKTLAVDLNGHLQIWDADAQKRLSHTRQSFGLAYALDYSPDSRRLVRAGGSLENVRVIEVPSGRYLPSNSGSGVGRLVVDGDSDVIAMTAEDGIRLIDLQTQRILKTIGADADDLYLSVGAGRLVGAMRDGKVRIWPIPPGGSARILAARRAVPRCLTFLQRLEAGLPPSPPRWCVTGPDQVASKDPALWAGKWPYHTNEWRDWLAARDRGENPDPPDLNEYSQKVEPGGQ
jgi:WD40 repeat protein